MGFLVRLLLFPILMVKRILLPMLGGALKVPFKIIKIFLLNKLVLMVLGIGALVAIAQKGSNSSGDMDPANTPPPILSKQEDPRTRDKITELPPLPAVIEDGNSAFAQKLWGKMEKPVQVIYSREFSFAIQYTPSGESHLFNMPPQNLFGKIMPKDVYQSKTGTYCRNFEELLVYKGVAQRYHGKSCQRKDNNGWCKLGPESTPNCELGYSEGTWGDIRRTWRRWF